MHKIHQYIEDDLLMLSGIQHIAFCERQYALAYMEMQWQENVLTVEGHHLHERADDPFVKEKRQGTIILRGISLTSFQLGLYGRADIVEFIKAVDKEQDSVSLNGYSGRWKPMPVEYKRGKPKPDERDEVQLCAQAMCLEEMYNINIKEGYLYYGQTRRRHALEFGSSLRAMVTDYARRMHEIFDSKTTPLPVYKPHCKSCSLIDICMPKAFDGSKSALDYLKTNLEF